MLKKIVAVFMSVTMIFSLWGCDNESEGEKTVDLSWYINFSWFATKWGENMVSKAITKKTGCNIDFVTPSGDPNEKLDSMIASDTLPDLITLGWWEPEISQMIEGDKVYALDTLADKYDTYFYKVINDEVVSWHKADDGHLYQYPNSACSPSDYDKYDNLASNETFLVRKDMYEAIGKPDMTTPEGFVKAVEKAAKMFPTIDGKEMIPVGCTQFNNIGCDSFDNYLLDFLAVPYTDKNGKAIDRLKNKSYVKWLKAYNKLGREGLLKDEIFLDSRTQMSEKINNGQYFCMIYQYTDLADQEKNLYAKDKDSKHDFGMNIIPAMLNDNKKLYAWEFDGYWKDVGTVDSLWEANMDLLKDKDLDLYNIKKDWKIYTEDTLGKPQIIGEKADVKNSLVTQGCMVNGTVEGSVLFNNVNVGEGAKVVDSVLMPGVLVEEGAEIYKAIIDENVVVKAGTVINSEAKEVELVSDNSR